MEIATGEISPAKWFSRRDFSRFMKLELSTLVVWHAPGRSPAWV